MIARLIRWSIHNRFLVLLATVLVTAWGVYSVTQTPLDALPDLTRLPAVLAPGLNYQPPDVLRPTTWLASGR